MPGRTVVPTLGMAARLSQIKPDKIYLSSCLSNTVPGCPYTSAKDLSDIIEKKTGIEVIIGTHNYH
jgi:predicted metal-binding protein